MLQAGVLLELTQDALTRPTLATKHRHIIFEALWLCSCWEGLVHSEGSIDRWGRVIMLNSKAVFCP